MIKLCKSNKFYEEIAKELKNNNLEFEHKKCLGECGDCHKGPIAKFHGDIIKADSVEKLIKKLK